MADWSKFDKNIDAKALKSEIKEAASGKGGNYPEVPHGTYEVKIQKMELKESSKGDPMVTIWFKVLDGKQKDGMIFMNQVVTQGFQIHIMNEFFRDMNVKGVNVEFDNYTQYNDMILDLSEEMEDVEFSLEYAQNEKNKNFSTYKITEIFD